MAGDDNRGVIDARERFGTRGREQLSPEERAAAAEVNRTKRLETLERHAGHLRAELDKAARLSKPDRIVLVRNFGRLVERAFKGTERKTATAIFKRAYGEESGASQDKKRKRFMRFEGEALSSGEYHARGTTFLKLVEAFLQEQFGEEPTEDRRWRTLNDLCEGASFAEPQKPRVFAGEDYRQTFRSCMRQMVDVVARESDIVSYLDEVRRFTVKEIYEPRDEMSRKNLTMSREELALRGFTPKRLEYYTSDLGSSSYWEATQLSLDGFDIRTVEPSNLLPRIRLARIFWPRRMLCLPASVGKTAFDAINTQLPSDAEMAHLIKSGETSEYLVSNWRDEERLSMLHDALRANGIDPDPRYINWKRFEDPETGKTWGGAEWYGYYQVRNYDLVLTAEHDPQNLRLGLFVTHSWESNCTLVDPCDDLTSSVQNLDFGLLNTEPDKPQVMLVGEKYHIAKGLGDFAESLKHDILPTLWETFVDANGDKAWELLSMQMEDWRTTQASTTGHRMPDPHVPPALRPCFDTPDGWAPAPDRSLASAMLRSLSLAKGAERLDQMLIEAVNVRVECLAWMKDGLEQTFERGLIESGYKP